MKIIEVKQGNQYDTYTVEIRGETFIHKQRAGDEPPSTSDVMYQLRAYLTDGLSFAEWCEAMGLPDDSGANLEMFKERQTISKKWNRIFDRDTTARIDAYLMDL